MEIGTWRFICKGLSKNEKLPKRTISVELQNMKGASVISKCRKWDIIGQGAVKSKIWAWRFIGKGLSKLETLKKNNMKKIAKNEREINNFKVAS